jgi:hypothetical protein
MSHEEAIARIWEMFEETAQRSRETDRKLDRLERTVERTSKIVGDLGNRLGEFVEYSMKPDLVRIFRERGLDVHDLCRDLTGEHNGFAAQVDLLVFNDDVCVAVEVKSKLKVEDVDRHVERMEHFRELFPRFASPRILGAIAAVVLPPDVAKYAYRRGFFVIGPKGESVEILNDLDFEPAEW